MSTFYSTKDSGTSHATPNISVPFQPTIPLDPSSLTAVPEGLEDIKPRPSQVCNCNEIGFDPNGSWRKVVCTYKFFTGDRMWRTQTVERSPL